MGVFSALAVHEVHFEVFRLVQLDQPGATMERLLNHTDVEIKDLQATCVFVLKLCLVCFLFPLALWTFYRLAH